MVRVERFAIAGILLVATALRLHALGVELWFDEIRTALRLAQLSPAELVATYESQNQHMLYSLLAELSLFLFGDGAAALRLPAVVFGVLGVAAVYALGKRVASKREGLLAAALLAVSYHDVWFSQNARGYTALAFFTLVATTLLLRALEHGRRRDWLGYAAATALGTYTHLTMLCVIAAHALVAARALRASSAAGIAPSDVRVGRRRRAWLLGFAACAILVLLAYAPVLPELWAVNTTEGRTGLVPEWSRVSWFAREVAVALDVAFARAGVAALVLALAAAGLARIARRSPRVAELFVLPVVVTALLLLVSGHHLWPRFFFFAIGFGALAVVSGALAVGEAIARLARRSPELGTAAGTVVALGIVVASAATVPAAYAPKQSFLAARDLVRRERRPEDAVAVLRPCQTVYCEYYGEDWRAISTLAELEEARSPSGRTWLVHSFPVSFQARHADMQAVLDAEFSLVGRFAGTLHDGTVLVWRAEPKPTAPTRSGGEPDTGRSDGTAAASR